VNVAIGTSNILAMWRISVNKNHRSKTLHLLVEINSHIVEGLVDIKASMSIIVASVVKESWIMHLVSGFKSYKIVFRMVIQAMGKMERLPIQIGDT
jgi:hypothetical protein